MSALMRIWRDPLLIKELRTRMRSRIAAAVVTLYVCAMSGFVLWIYTSNGGFTHGLGSDIGRDIFMFISAILLWVIMLVSPLVTAGSVSGERDHKTFESLMVAPISLTRITVTKLTACMAYFVALLFLSLPPFSVSFILGGVSPANILETLLGLMAVALTGCCIGLYWSTRFKRSIAAIPVASVMVVGLALLFSSLSSGEGSIIGLVSPIDLIDAITTEQIIPCFSFTVPAVLPGVLLPLFVAGWFFEAARQNLHFREERRFVLLRTWFFIAIVVLWAFVVGEGMAAGQSRDIEGSLILHWVEVGGGVLGGLTAIALIITPWTCCAVPITYSDPDRLVLDGRRRPFLHGWLLDGVPFTLTLLAVLAVVLIGGLVVAGAPPQSVTRVACAAGSGIFPIVLTTALLGRWLSGTRSMLRRWVGMIVTYLVIGALCIAPSLLPDILSFGYNKIPAWLQWWSLLTPEGAITWLQLGRRLGTWVPDVVKVLPFHPLWVPVIFHGALAIVLLIPAYLTRCRRPPAEPEN